MRNQSLVFLICYYTNENAVSYTQLINGKSLIMQLFREHGISVPLKTQGWIINTLHSIRYSPQSGQWSYRYHKGSRNSMNLPELLSKLLAAIQSKPPHVGCLLYTSRCV